MIATLSLIFPIPASTEKLKFVRMIQTLKILQIVNRFPEKINFFQKRTNATSGPSAIKNAARLNARIEKNV